jgi:hypothetical protein
MVDRTFAAYAGYGYMSYKGGSMLDINDYSGLAALLVSNPIHQESNDAKMRAALQRLRTCGNPMVENLLTCLERYIDHPQPTDQFPLDAGQGGMPMLSETDADAAAIGALANEDDAGPVGNDVGQEAVRVLRAQRLSGIFQTVDELDIAATHEANHPMQQTTGSVRSRHFQATAQYGTTSRDKETALDAALHTTLHPKALDARYEHSTACSTDHYNKVRLGGVVPKFRHAEEFLWSRYQTAMKSRFHARSSRMVNADVAASATRANVAAQEEALQRQRLANPGLADHIETAHTYSGGVGKNVVGGKRYWHEAFCDIMAMAVQYGVPQFFATFTANEKGWADVTAISASPRRLGMRAGHAKTAGHATVLRYFEVQFFGGGPVPP